MTFLHDENFGLGFRSAVKVQAILLTRLVEGRELRERRGVEGKEKLFFPCR